MPAIGAQPHARTPWLLRSIVGTLAFAFLAGISVTSAPSVGAARNWSHQIAATRSSQIAYESAMRAADHELRRLKKAGKRATRKLKKAKRNLRLAKRHKVEVEARWQTTRHRFERAQASLAERTEGPVPLVRLPSISPAFSSLHAAAPASSTLSVMGLDAGDGTPPGALPPPPPAEYTPTEVTALEREASRQKRAYLKAKKKIRRVQRSKRLKTRNIASIKRMRRATVARRRGAEAALASRILSMSELAQRRVAKKTKVRPGSNSGFVWPTRGRIAQTYGCTGFYLNPPRGGCRHFHDGIDIAGYRGTAIRAAAVGVISYIGWNPWDSRPRAFMIVVAHPGGYETLYGHVLPTRRVRVGQLVRKGELIGYMGSTGHSTGVHLHLELRRGRHILNPLAFL